MRRFSSRVSVVALFCGSSVLLACGSNIRPKQLDEPCTRSAQCDVGLVCLTGVCQPAPEEGSGGASGAGGSS